MFVTYEKIDFTMNMLLLNSKKWKNYELTKKKGLVGLVPDLLDSFAGCSRPPAASA